MFVKGTCRLYEYLSQTIIRLRGRYVGDDDLMIGNVIKWMIEINIGKKDIDIVAERSKAQR